MPCYAPIKGYRSAKLSANGKRPLMFSSVGSTGDVQEIACGQCMGCRLERSRQWAVRISNEASLYEENAFITLTYAPENLPPGGSLQVRDFQLFMKRLRKHYASRKIRFFHCGEYGEQLGRPHYHACLLGFDFPDKYHWRTSGRGDYIYRSDTLEKLWSDPVTGRQLGLCEIGTLSFESAAYVARYITKKITGTQADGHYSSLDSSTGELVRKSPEYITMSRRPGIGAPWLERYHADVYSHDNLVLRGGVKIPPPKFYDSRYELMQPEDFKAIKERRLNKQFDDLSTGALSLRLLDNSPERLKVRETVHGARVGTLKRSYEECP